MSTKHVPGHELVREYQAGSLNAWQYRCECNRWGPVPEPSAREPLIGKWHTRMTAAHDKHVRAAITKATGSTA